MTLEPRLSDDVFIHIPPDLSNASRQKSSTPIHLIFFIPGNPGLLGYYHEFFALLTQSKSANQYAIVGMTLGGFEAEGNFLDWNDEDLMFPDTIAAKRSAKRRGEEPAWWSLEEQIDLTLLRIDEVVRRLRVMSKGRDVQVTLMGHSLGTYMSLEVVRKVSERSDLHHDPGMDESGVLGVGNTTDKEYVEWEVESCMCLAPTIMELAKSSSGRKAAPLLSTVVFLPWLLQLLAGGLVWVLSMSNIQWLVARFTGLPTDHAGVSTTARFLMSSAGVRQSLELAKDELRDIARDDWGSEVWGAVQALQMGGLDQDRGPKLFFLFAQVDHWVADTTRAQILRSRARQDGHGSFVVDETKGLKHAWCLNQNKEVVDYIEPWLEDVIR